MGGGRFAGVGCFGETAVEREGGRVSTVGGLVWGVRLKNTVLWSDRTLGGLLDRGGRVEWFLQTRRWERGVSA